MYRLLLIMLVAAAFFSSCSKDNTAADVVAAQLVKDDALINQYLSANNIKASQVDSSGVATGIYYKIDTAGVANTLYTNASTVTIAYAGWAIQSSGALTDTIGSSGTRFHPSFVLGSVMRGWQLGIPEVGNGGEITLYLPSKYAYGPYAQPTLGLPANSVLVFNIVVYNVTN